MSETYLVTGGAGFVGSRMVAYLRNRGHRVRAMTKRPPSPLGGAASEDHTLGDVTDPASLPKAMRGCSVVFHCAWGGSILSDARRINVAGTRNVVSAAAEANVRRVVHISSLAVHGQVLPSELTEEYPMTASGDAYALSKAEGEREAFAAGREHGIEVVALRPTLVYGPGAPLWVRNYFMRVKRERVSLLNGGEGLVNLIFVDDLLDGMWAAAHCPDAAGAAFLMSGAVPVTWRAYLSAFAKMCGKPDPPAVPLWRSRWGLTWGRAYALLTQRDPRVTRTDVELMSQRCHVSIAKARRQLRYAPRVNFEEGMRHCQVWLEDQGYLGRSDRLGTR